MTVVTSVGYAQETGTVPVVPPVNELPVATVVGMVKKLVVSTVVGMVKKLVVSTVVGMVNELEVTTLVAKEKELDTPLLNEKGLELATTVPVGSSEIVTVVGWALEISKADELPIGKELETALLSIAAALPEGTSVRDP